MSSVMTPIGMGKLGWQNNALQQVSNISNMPTPVPASSKLKRRFEGDEDYQDSTPASDRPKKAAPKRSKQTKERETSQKANENDDVDVGVLLASLPPESHLPILNALINDHPSLKSYILSHIPRPALNTAIDALSSASRQLRDAYPYSNSSTSHPSTPFSNSSPFSQPHSFSAFGSPVPARPLSASSFSRPAATDTGGMRETYIQSRLRPHIEKFVATCMTYLPYFTLLPQQSHSLSIKSPSNPPSSTINETYSFLFHLTSQILAQQPLTQASLVPMILPRLTEEWMAWANRVDEHVNQHAGMFGTDVVNTWYRGLEDFCRAKSSQDLVDLMQNVRKKWVASVGWMIGRFPSPEPMDV